jgi:hypothetical protein
VLEEVIAWKSIACLLVLTNSIGLWLFFDLTLALLLIFCLVALLDFYIFFFDECPTSSTYALFDIVNVRLVSPYSAFG